MRYHLKDHVIKHVYTIILLSCLMTFFNGPVCFCQEARILISPVRGVLEIDKQDGGVSRVKDPIFMDAGDSADIGKDSAALIEVSSSYLQGEIEMGEISKVVFLGVVDGSAKGPLQIFFEVEYGKIIVSCTEKTGDVECIIRTPTYAVKMEEGVFSIDVKRSQENP